MPGAPLVYVDGVTVQAPLLEALGSGFADIPLLLGSVRDEDDVEPNSTVYSWGWSEFEAQYLRANFANYPAGTSAALSALYGEQGSYHAPTAPQSFYDLCADICLACGTHAVASAAAGGLRSGVYVMTG